MQTTLRKAQIEETPALRKVEKLDALLRDIRDDARSLSEAYPKQTVVPEGGE